MKNWTSYFIPLLFCSVVFSSALDSPAQSSSLLSLIVLYMLFIHVWYLILFSTVMFCSILRASSWSYRAFALHTLQLQSACPAFFLLLYWLEFFLTNWFYLTRVCVWTCYTLPDTVNQVRCFIHFTSVDSYRILVSFHLSI